MPSSLTSLFAALTILASPTQAKPPERPPAGPEPRVEYSTFGDLYGKPEQVKLASDGGHFLALYFPKDGTSVLRLWRIEKNEAFQLRSWSYAKKGLLENIWTQAAVGPEGKYVAISAGRESDYSKQRLVFHRVSDDDRDTFDLSDIDHDDDRHNKSCGMEFLDADRLVACRLGHASKGHHWQNTLALVSGFVKSKPRHSDRSGFTALAKVEMARPNGDTITLTRDGYAHGYGDVVRETFVQVDGAKFTKAFDKESESKFKLTDYRSSIPLGRAGMLAMNKHRELAYWRSIEPNSGVKQTIAVETTPRLAASDAAGDILLGHRGEVWTMGKSSLISLAPEQSAPADSVFTGPRSLVTVTSEKIVRKEIGEQLVKSGKLHEEGISLLKAGFAGPGFAKLRESVDSAPERWTAPSLMDSEQLALAISKGEIKASLTETGKFLQHLVKVLGRKKPGARLPVTLKENLKIGKTCPGVEDPLQAAGAQPGDRLSAVNGQAIASAAELDALMAGLQPGATATATVTKADGKQLTATLTLLANWQWNRGYHFMNLYYLGLLAAQAGQPGITLQAEAAIRKLLEAGELCPPAKGAANLLGGLARAMNENPDAGYEYMLTNGGLVIAGDRTLGAAYAERFHIAVGPLYANRDKMAFLMETPRDKLYYSAPAQREAQPFPDIEGRMVEPPAGGKKQKSQAPKPPASGSPPSKGGRVLE